MKRMLTGRGFLTAVFLGVLGILLGTEFPEIENGLEPGSFVNLEVKALSSQMVSFVLPVLSVLPWSDSFLEEWRGGFLKSSLPRTGRRGYVESKIFTVALSGFLAVMLSGLVVLFGYFLVFYPMEFRGTFPVNVFWDLLEILLRCGLVSGVLGTLGGLCGTLTGSSYMAYGLPFVGYYFCIILHERYFSEAFWLYPPEWLTASTWWGEGNQGLWLFLLVLLGVVMGIHGGVLYGRLEEI